MLHSAKNLDPADWVVKHLNTFAINVGSIVPGIFEAYARVFHPGYRNVPDWKTPSPVRWSEVAAANGRIAHPEMQLPGITGLAGFTANANANAFWDRGPMTGSMPREITDRLSTILVKHTQTPDSCWFGVWEGFADLTIPADARLKFSIPGRDHFLLHGAVSDAPQNLSVTEIDWEYRSPNLWWPDDKAWCVATEIDFEWTYVGGSAAAIQEILSDPALEALPARVEDGVTRASDQVNPQVDS